MTPKDGIEPASPATVRPSVGSSQPMAASTPGPETNITNPELPPSPPPEIRENAKSSSTPSSVPATALVPLAVVPTSLTTDVANSSLVQRVPKTYRHIAGRCPIQSVLGNRAKNSKERPKELAKANAPKNDIPKPKAGGTSPQDAISMQPSTSAEVPRNQSKVAKSPRGKKRKHLSEGRVNAELSPSQPVKHKFIKFKVDQVGVLVLNLDQLQQQVSIAGRNNPPESMEPIPVGIGGSNDPENPDNNTTDSLPGKDPPKTKKCLIM